MLQGWIHILIDIRDSETDIFKISKEDIYIINKIKCSLYQITMRK